MLKRSQCQDSRHEVELTQANGCLVTLLTQSATLNNFPAEIPTNYNQLLYHEIFMQIHLNIFQC